MLRTTCKATHHARKPVAYVLDASRHTERWRDAQETGTFTNSSAAKPCIYSRKSTTASSSPLPSSIAFVSNCWKYQSPADGRTSRRRSEAHAKSNGASARRVSINKGGQGRRRQFQPRTTSPLPNLFSLEPST